MEDKTYKSLRKRRDELQQQSAEALATADQELYTKTKQELFRVQELIDQENKQSATMILAFLIAASAVYFTIFYGIIGTYEAIKNGSRPSWFEFIWFSALVTYITFKITRWWKK